MTWRDDGNNAEQLFYDEVRTKKLAANGVHGKTGKRGLIGSVRYPSDAIKGKKKLREYANISKETRVYNVWDEKILSKTEFQALPFDKQVVALETWREKFSMKAVAEAWGLKDGSLYYVLEKMGLHKTKKGNGAGRPSEKKKSQIPMEQILEAIEGQEHKLIPRHIFDELSDEKRKELMEKWRETYRVRALAEYWGLAETYMRKLCVRMGVIGERGGKHAHLKSKVEINGKLTVLLGGNGTVSKPAPVEEIQTEAPELNIEENSNELIEPTQTKIQPTQTKSIVPVQPARQQDQELAFEYRGVYDREILQLLLSRFEGDMVEFTIKRK